MAQSHFSAATNTTIKYNSNIKVVIIWVQDFSGSFFFFFLNQPQSYVPKPFTSDVNSHLLS